eukprot:c33214_g1_i1 orf=2-172(-)
MKRYDAHLRAIKYDTCGHYTPTLMGILPSHFAAKIKSIRRVILFAGSSLIDTTKQTS